jgi:hypothetical protein
MIGTCSSIILDSVEPGGQARWTSTMASGWVKMKTSPAGAPFRYHTFMKHNPGRHPVFRCSSRTSIELKFSQMSCSGYRPLKDIFPLRGAVGSDDVDRTDDGFDFARSDLPDECLAMPKLDPRAAERE